MTRWVTRRQSNSFGTSGKIKGAGGWRGINLANSLIGFARCRIFTAMEDNATASGHTRLDASSRLSRFHVWHAIKQEEVCSTMNARLNGDALRSVIALRFWLRAFPLFLLFSPPLSFSFYLYLSIFLTSDRLIFIRPRGYWITRKFRNIDCILVAAVLFRRKKQMANVTLSGIISAIYALILSRTVIPPV